MAFVSVTASVACKMNRKERNIFSLLINSIVFIQKTPTPDLTSCTSGKKQGGGGGGGADLPPIWHYSPKVFKRSVPFSFLRQYESINMKSWILLILNKLSELMRTPFPNPPHGFRGGWVLVMPILKMCVYMYSLVSPLWKKVAATFAWLQFQPVWPRMNKCDHWTLKNCVQAQHSTK